MKQRASVRASFEPREFIAQSDKVVVLGRETGRVKSTGRTFQSDWAMDFTLQNGKVVKFPEYADTANLDAAIQYCASGVRLK